MRARSALVLVTLLLAPVALAGCFSATDAGIRLTPFAAVVTAEPGRLTQFAVHVDSSSPFRSDLDLGVRSAPANWTVEPEFDVLSVNGRSASFFIVNVTPAEDARFGLNRVVVTAGGAATELLVNVGELGREPAREGVGVQVFTVGYWDNGTVFYTNMREVRDNPHIPWHHLDENADADEYMEPLKVYVGGKRGERPPEPYNSSGYSPVIKGFNDRLLGNGGMRADETLVVRIAPEDAYTYEGNEDHDLYGDALNFLVHVVSVDVLEDSRICVPNAPPEACVDPENPTPPVASGDAFTFRSTWS